MNDLKELRGKIHRLWWIPLITGIIAVGLGVWCFLSPQTSLPVFAYTFSALIVLAGVLNLVYAGVNAGLRTNWGWSLALGLLEIICGVWMFTLPATTLAVAFVFAIGIWVLIAAINSVCEATCFARYSAGWTVWMIIVLVATIFCAFYFLADPIAGGIAGWIWLGISLICFGIWRISLAFKLRSFNSYASRYL